MCYSFITSVKKYFKEYCLAFLWHFIICQMPFLTFYCSCKTCNFWHFYDRCKSFSPFYNTYLVILCYFDFWHLPNMWKVLFTFTFQKCAVSFLKFAWHMPNFFHFTTNHFWHLFSHFDTCQMLLWHFYNT